MLSSKTFYTYFANFYSDYSILKKDYLLAVNNFIKSESKSPQSIIDVGSGDGIRGKEIANLLGIDAITLVENSKCMFNLSKKIHGATLINKDISSNDFKLENKYDVVTCLWNVIGHIPNFKRKRALENLASLVKDNGVIFLDVNNRYNISQYGIKSSVINIIKDLLNKKSSNGDFILTINIPKREIQTVVHIFSPKEIENLISSAGLNVEKRLIINYKSGEIKKYVWNGQLIYKLSKK